MGAALFAANRVNIGKFLVGIGTGQGLFTIALRILSEVWSGHSLLANNYVIWLTSSAAGLGILFAVLSQFQKEEETVYTIRYVGSYYKAIVDYA